MASNSSLMSTLEMWTDTKALRQAAFRCQLEIQRHFSPVAPFSNSWRAGLKQKNYIVWVFSSNNSYPPCQGDGDALLDKINPLKLEKSSSLFVTFQNFLQTMQWSLACAKWVLAVSEWLPMVLCQVTLALAEKGKQK